jgi:uncharacterized heparinase superfamily protein
MEARMQSLAGTTWKLIDASAFDAAGHALPSPLGPHPMGFAIFEAERVIVAVSDGRTSLPPDVQSRAFVAYTGRYHFDGSELVTTVDGASNPDVPTQQIRHLRFESPARMVVTPKNTVLAWTAGLKFVWEMIA